MMNTLNRFKVVFLILIIALFGCKKEGEVAEPELPINTTGKIQVQFSHTMGTEPLVLNSNQYTNEAGNRYEITELMYFVSDFVLYSHLHTPISIDAWTAIHYVDVLHPESLIWNVFDSIPQGIIDSVSFTFGISAQRNQSFMFVNPPESNMAWPDVLGGGYHYLMINGRWIDAQEVAQPYNFHLGIGQIYSDTITYNTNSITGFVQNYFRVTLATPNLSISSNNSSVLRINMDVSSWFKTPFVWDFNYWGGAVMQNQRAMQTIKENGADVFSAL